MGGSTPGLRFPLLAAALGVLLVACSGPPETVQQISYRCECPQFQAAVAQPPPGASWWPTYWETYLDQGALHADGSVAADDVTAALTELRALFDDHDWEVSGYPNEQDGQAELGLGAPENLLDGRRFEISALELEGQLLIHFKVGDHIGDYTGWDYQTYVQAFDEGWPELYEADVVRDERAAALYRQLIAGF